MRLVLRNNSVRKNGLRKRMTPKKKKQTLKSLIKKVNPFRKKSIKKESKKKQFSPMLEAIPMIANPLKQSSEPTEHNLDSLTKKEIVSPTKIRERYLEHLNPSLRKQIRGKSKSKSKSKSRSKSVSSLKSDYDSFDYQKNMNDYYENYGI